MMLHSFSQQVNGLSEAINDQEGWGPSATLLKVQLINKNHH